MLTLNNVAKQKLFSQLNLTIAKGEVLGIKGPSGSGKSTLLKCLAGLSSFDEGVVDAKGQIGMLFQSYPLFNHMTVLDNLCYAPKKILKHSATTAILNAQNLLGQFGLSELSARYPHQISGGQKQRVALIRALLLNPDIILMDEPTAALDTVNIKAVHEQITKLKKAGKTIVLASHDESFLASVSDRVLNLANYSSN